MANHVNSVLFNNQVTLLNYGNSLQLIDASFTRVDADHSHQECVSFQPDMCNEVSPNKVSVLKLTFSYLDSSKVYSQDNDDNQIYGKSQTVSVNVLPSKFDPAVLEDLKDGLDNASDAGDRALYAMKYITYTVTPTEQIVFERVKTKCSMPSNADEFDGYSDTNCRGPVENISKKYTVNVLSVGIVKK